MSYRRRRRACAKDEIGRHDDRGSLSEAAAGVNHSRVNHSACEYICDTAHTDCIERFWALLKRGYIDVDHCKRAKHLPRGVKKFAFCHDAVQFDAVDFIVI